MTQALETFLNSKETAEKPPLYQARVRMLELFEELRLKSYPSTTAIPSAEDVYKDPFEISMAEWLIRGYCDYYQVLTPVIRSEVTTVVEDQFAVGEIDTLHFSRLYWCLGVIYQFEEEGIEIAGHLTPNQATTEVLQDYAEKMNEFFLRVSGGKRPSKIIFVSPYLGVHETVMKTVCSIHSSAEILLQKSSDRNIESTKDKGLVK